MIERWNINKCAAIRRALKIPMKDVGDRVGWTKQSIHNMESGRSGIGGKSLMRMEILYTLALKDIIEERGLNLDTVIEDYKTELRAQIALLEASM